MRRAVVLAVVGVVVVFYSSPAPAQSNSSSLGTAAVAGTTIKVNTKADENNTDGDCSLREAIVAANTNKAVDGCAAGSSTKQDAIHFVLGTQAKITLVTALAIKDPSGLTIDGQQAKITVSGHDAVRVFDVKPGAKLALLHLTVANGNSAVGGGLFNYGGKVKVINSTFSGNSADFAGGGHGGGISNSHGSTLTVINSTFSGNSAASGGGIANGSGGTTLTVINSTFSGNHARIEGGVLVNFYGRTKVSNSTFSGNRAFAAAGIANDDTLEVSNSTFSGNHATEGGGITNAFRGTLKVINSTFSANSGGGIHNQLGTTTFKNTIVANSTKGPNCSTRHGKIIDGGYNIEDGTSCSFRAANHSLPSTNPKLANSLSNNGGPTATIKLLEGSPAINAIPQATNGCGTQIRTDQRGVKRPQGNRCDIGAFEKRQ